MVFPEAITQERGGVGLDIESNESESETAETEKNASYH
jgi:hypothetical protein